MVCFRSLYGIGVLFLIRILVNSGTGDFCEMGGSGLVLVECKLAVKGEIAGFTGPFLRCSDLLIALFDLCILPLTPTLKVCGVTLGIIALTSLLVLLCASGIYLCFLSSDLSGGEAFILAPDLL